MVFKFYSVVFQLQNLVLW